MLYYTRLEMVDRDNHSSLLVPFVSYEENEVLWMWPLEPAQVIDKFTNKHCTCLLRLTRDTQAYLNGASITNKDFYKIETRWIPCPRRWCPWPSWPRPCAGTPRHRPDRGCWLLRMSWRCSSLHPPKWIFLKKKSFKISNRQMSQSGPQPTRSQE